MLYLSALHAIEQSQTHKLKTETPKWAACSCGGCKLGWYSPRMNLLVSSQAQWASSLLEGEDFYYTLVRRMKYNEKNFQKAVVPFDFPPTGHVKSYLIAYTDSVDRITLSEPPFISDVNYPGSYKDPRTWLYFINNGGQADWALTDCLTQVKNNYGKLLEFHFTEIMEHPECNNDWKFDEVFATLFHKPAEVTPESKQLETHLKQIYDTVCAKMKINPIEDPPEFDKEYVPLKMENCGHLGSDQKVCASCGQDPTIIELERARITFKKCPHEGRPKDWEGMCQGCHSRVRYYPYWWHQERAEEYQATLTTTSQATTSKFQTTTTLSTSTKIIPPPTTTIRSTASGIQTTTQQTQQNKTQQTITQKTTTQQSATQQTSTKQSSIPQSPKKSFGGGIERYLVKIERPPICKEENSESDKRRRI